MDGSILVVASPSLHSTLGASGADVQLVVAMYTLVFGALVVIGARLGDVVGQRKAFVGGLAAFTVFSLAGGLAPSPAALIVVRGLQGAAGAVMTAQVLVLIQTGYEGEARAYGGFLLTLTLYLQGSRHLTPLQAGLTCAIYASGFAVASLGSARLRERLRNRLPPLGALTLAAALVAVGLIAGTGRWPLDAVAPLLLIAGAGHAAGFYPLAHRLTSTTELDRASDLSGLILTAGLIGQVIGVAAFTGIYLNIVSDGAPNALRATTLAIGGALVACTAFTVAGSGQTAQAPSDTSRPSSNLPTSQV